VKLLLVLLRLECELAWQQWCMFLRLVVFVFALVLYVLHLNHESSMHLYARAAAGVADCRACLV
jgi:hypothetical protein